MIWMAVLVGGALGSAARHSVSIAAARLLGNPGPFSTASVNMIGSLVIGTLAGALAAQRLTMSPTMRAFVFVGLLGGFTTFSSFVLDSLTLFDAGAFGRTTVNLVGQAALGFLLVYAGFRLGLGTIPN